MAAVRAAVVLIASIRSARVVRLLLVPEPGRDLGSGVLARKAEREKPLVDPAFGAVVAPCAAPTRLVANDMPAIRRDGVTLHYRDEGRGPPLLLLHAFPLESEQYLPQIEALASKHRIIAPDHRGFGQSTLAAGAHATEMSELADDAVAILDELGIRQAVIGGVSMGGYATMALLRKHEVRARALVLIDTQQSADVEATKKWREETALATIAKGTSALVEAFLPKLIAPSASPELKAKVEAMIRAGSPAGGAAALRGMALRPASDDVLARFTRRALVIVGEEDVLTPPAKAEDIARTVASSKLVRIPNVGHLSNLEAPEAVNRALRDFLASLDAS